MPGPGDNLKVNISDATYLQGFWKHSQLPESIRGRTSYGQDAMLDVYSDHMALHDPGFIYRLGEDPIFGNPSAWFCCLAVTGAAIILLLRDAIARVAKKRSRSDG
jgi:hypothetical protein